MINLWCIYITYFKSTPKAKKHTKLMHIFIEILNLLSHYAKIPNWMSCRYIISSKYKGGFKVIK